MAATSSSSSVGAMGPLDLHFSAIDNHSHFNERQAVPVARLGESRPARTAEGLGHAEPRRTRRAPSFIQLVSCCRPRGSVPRAPHTRPKNQVRLPLPFHGEQTSMQHPDPAHIARLQAREAARFAQMRPRSAELLARARRSMARGVPMGWMTAIYQHAPMFAAEGDGAWFSDVDGHRYLDMNVADLSMNGGFGPPAVVAAVAERMRRGSQFLLPTEDAIAVAEALARRYPLPCWQFTLSASGANAEIIRLARHATGREKILMFDGKYHGHIEDTLVVVQDGRVQPEMAGLPAEPARRAKMVDYNDLAAVERALAARDVALVIVEPALTNVGVVLPEAGFHAGLRALTKAAGTLLAYDEAHTFVAGPAGLVGAWQLACDAVGLGKALGGGVPIGAYGVSTELA